MIVFITSGEFNNLDPQHVSIPTSLSTGLNVKVILGMR